MNSFKTQFDFTTFHFFLCFVLHQAIRNKMKNQIENVAYQLFSRRRYFVHRKLTNHSEDHDKLIILGKCFFDNSLCHLEIKLEINQQYST